MPDLSEIPVGDEQLPPQKPMTLRQAAKTVRELLRNTRLATPYATGRPPEPLAFPKVKAQTVSFEGFGFGHCGFIELDCDDELPADERKALRLLQQNFRTPETKFIIRLVGAAYPFGAKP